jgi:hypothetical protein
MISEVVIQVDNDEEKALYKQSDRLCYSVTYRNNQPWEIHFAENMCICDKRVHGSRKAIRKKRPYYTSR